MLRLWWSGVVIIVDVLVNNADHIHNECTDGYWIVLHTQYFQHLLFPGQWLFVCQMSADSVVCVICRWPLYVCAHDEQCCQTLSCRPMMLNQTTPVLTRVCDGKPVWHKCACSSMPGTTRSIDFEWEKPVFSIKVYNYFTHTICMRFSSIQINYSLCNSIVGLFILFIITIYLFYLFCIWLFVFTFYFYTIISPHLFTYFFMYSSCMH